MRVWHREVDLPERKGAGAQHHEQTRNHHGVRGFVGASQSVHVAQFESAIVQPHEPGAGGRVGKEFGGAVETRDP